MSTSKGLLLVLRFSNPLPRIKYTLFLNGVDLSIINIEQRSKNECLLRVYLLNKP